jgi:hypothetical protein
VGVVEEAGELAGAEHAGLIHHQHRPGVQQPPVVGAAPAARVALLVQFGQQAVDGVGVLEAFGAQADGGDPGRCSAKDSVAVQLPGVPGDSEGEGLAGAGPSDRHLDAGAALGEVADHRLLVGADAGMGGQRVPHSVGCADPDLLGRPADRRVQQPLLDLEQFGGGPAVLPDGVLGHHAHTAFGQEPVGQPLQLGRADGGELAAEGNQDLAAGEGRGVGSEPFGTYQLIEHPPDGHAVRGDVALAADHLAE